jgi:hypothetical protein
MGVTAIQNASGSGHRAAAAGTTIMSAEGGPETLMSGTGGATLSASAAMTGVLTEAMIEGTTGGVMRAEGMAGVSGRGHLGAPAVAENMRSMTVTTGSLVVLRWAPHETCTRALAGVEQQMYVHGVGWQGLW